MPKRVLVTGGAGFVGSHTVDALLQRGHEVRIFDNFTQQVHSDGLPAYLPQDAEVVNGDALARAFASWWRGCARKLPKIGRAMRSPN